MKSGAKRAQHEMRIIVLTKRMASFGSAVDHNTYFLSNLTDGAQLSGGGTCNSERTKGMTRRLAMSPLVSRPETMVNQNGILIETKACLLGCHSFMIAAGFSPASKSFDLGLAAPKNDSEDEPKPRAR